MSNENHYQRTRLKRPIVIHNLISLYYYEFGKHYIFRGEKHDFWEVLYVDKGEIEVMADTTRHLLKQGMIIFHKPNEFHSFYAYKGKAPNVIVFTFDCKSPAMRHFENQVIVLNDEERNLLAQIVKEGMASFHFPFRYPLSESRRDDAPFGSEQLIKLNIEMLLIRLMRRDFHTETSEPLSSTARENDNAEVIKRVIAYMEERLDANVSLAEIGDALHISKTRLKDLFKKSTGSTIMEYFAGMKIKQAKQLIRDETYNMTEISGMLGFSSVHYFSKAFKKTTGMSPTEYARSVKGRLKSGAE
ncbi:helix-turn-helix domain-containing protein [Paenibacillus contaminans]|uniref:AraC family transcriptional regulator n=1 Tax=Paenibacillus contaminans TaxID=450362 RepID=A0A329M9I5_9BACL|nr:AraC family transcriptional regulator [Paenibacillus contaminans]RAV16418.1 AraC family transcriptional regulator [Paenibacillus contaminans]